jgi:hypothetical protein
MIHSDVVNYNTISIASIFFTLFSLFFGNSTIYFKNNDLQKSAEARAVGGKERGMEFGRRTGEGSLFFARIETVAAEAAKPGATYHELT